MEFTVRDATEADLPAIVDIYNQSIPGGWSTADTQPISVADRIEWQIRSCEATDLGGRG